jgi:hypothetical protein
MKAKNRIDGRVMRNDSTLIPVWLLGISQGKMDFEPSNPLVNVNRGLFLLAIDDHPK